MSPENSLIFLTYSRSDFLDSACFQNVTILKLTDFGNYGS